MRLSLLAGSRQPLPGVALIFVITEVGRIKGHSRMQMRDMCFDPSLTGVTIQRLIPGQAVALANIVRQFLHQHRRVTFAIILNRAPDVADIQCLFGGHQRFQEQIAVIIATAAVAALRFLTH